MTWPHGEKPGRRALLRNLLGVNRKDNFYSASEFLSFRCKLNRKPLSELMPRSLATGDHPTGLFFFAKHNDCVMECQYLEAALLIEVQTLFGRGYHFLWAVVDSDFALTLGREALGVPKKMAQMSWERSSDKKDIVSITRNSNGLLDIRANRLTRKQEPFSVLGKPIYNAGGPGQVMLLQPIWKYHSPETITKAENISLQCQIYSSHADPLQDLIGKDPKILDSQYCVADIKHGSYMYPVGFAGPGWVARSFDIRYR